MMAIACMSMFVACDEKKSTTGNVENDSTAVDSVMVDSVVVDSTCVDSTAIL